MSESSRPTRRPRSPRTTSPGFTLSAARSSTLLQLAQTAKAKLPDNPGVNDTLGWVYHKKGLGTQAVAALQEAVTRSHATRCSSPPRDGARGPGRPPEGPGSAPESPRPGCRLRRRREARLTRQDFSDRLHFRDSASLRCSRTTSSRFASDGSEPQRLEFRLAA